MRWKRTALLLVGVAAALVVAAGSFYLYRSFHPNIIITRMIKDSDVQSEDEYYCEWMMAVTTESPMIPVAQSVKEKLRELSDWNNGVVTDLYEHYVAPLHITVSGEVNDGQTTFWYEGYATTPQGDTVQYREEKTFDYVFVPGDELFS